jgi:hypothetical protein
MFIYSLMKMYGKFKLYDKTKEVIQRDVTIGS